MIDTVTEPVKILLVSGSTRGHPAAMQVIQAILGYLAAV
jgi:hypothetical protein